jgi:hypothetical protein
MQQRFHFDGAAVRELLAESEAAEERLLTEAQRYLAAGIDLTSDDPRVLDEPEEPATGAPPGLWLMNDRGVYLRSNAGDRPGGEVAYAEGYESDAPFGDEALCEFLDAGPLRQVLPGDTLVVTVDEKKLRLSVIRPE